MIQLKSAKKINTIKLVTNIWMKRVIIASLFPEPNQMAGNDDKFIVFPFIT